MLEGLARTAALLLAACLISAKTVQAGDLLRVDGGNVKWRAPASRLVTEVTYAALAKPYSLPSGRNTLSPENCGTMRPFAEIVSTTSGVSHVTASSALLSAFAAWEAAACIRFVEVNRPQHADIIVGAMEASNGRAFANLSLRGSPRGQPSAKALGAGSDSMAVDLSRSIRGRPIAAIEQAYICLNSRQPWKAGFDGNLGVYDLRYTFMHEIGHAISLDHPGGSGSIMGYRYDEQVPQLQPSDIGAAQLLYGPPLHDRLRCRPE